MSVTRIDRNKAIFKWTIAYKSKPQTTTSHDKNFYFVSHWIISFRDWKGERFYFSVKNVKIRDRLFCIYSRRKFWNDEQWSATALNGKPTSHSSELERLHTHTFRFRYVFVLFGSNLMLRRTLNGFGNSECEKPTTESAFQHENDENVYNFLFFSNKIIGVIYLEYDQTESHSVKPLLEHCIMRSHIIAFVGIFYVRPYQI